MSLSMGVRRCAGAAIALALLVGGCGSVPADTASTPVGATGGTGTGTSGTGGTGGTAADGDGSLEPEGPGPSDRPDPALSGQPTPSRPPGDPGGPGGPDRGTDGDHPGGDPSGEGGTDVPAGALVDAGTLAALAGGTWSPAPVPADCTAATPTGALAARSGTLAAADGALTETVAGYADPEAANAAVPDTGKRLAACGFTVTGDPRLGEASVELAGADSGDRAIVVASDGALLVLVASGSAAAPRAWESLVDVALGTACAGAPHGCH